MSNEVEGKVYAFGKLDLSSPLTLRACEVYFGIRARDPDPEAWKSIYPSVQRLLNHLSRYTKSSSSREVYLNVLRRFCQWSGYGPDELVRLPKERAENLVQSYADGLAAKDRSKAYVNSVIKRLKTFFKVNGYAGETELNIRTYFLPARYRKVPEYIPTKREVHSMADAADGRRDRAIILALWSSGLRVSTFCALNYGDVVAELENGEPHVMIPVYPKMKERVADACKGLVSYYSFICTKAGEALRSYLRERKEKYGQIKPEDPLFHSDWTLWARRERSGKRLGRRGIGLIVKSAARLAGIRRWKYVTPHCLRKAFESVLRSPTIDGGRMDKGTQEFLMGHILPGTQDAYYDKTNIDFHRSEYAKLDFSQGGTSAKVVDKLIDMAELEEHLNGGWMFVAKISDRKAIVRRTD